MTQQSTAPRESQVAAPRNEELSALVTERGWRFLAPLATRLDAYLDRRLARTMVRLVAIMVRHCHWEDGLLLSRLGDTLAVWPRGGRLQVQPAQVRPQARSDVRTA